MNYNKDKTIHQRFTELDSERQTLLDDKREAAAFTIPTQLPPQGWNEEDELDPPLNSKPALGSASLATRITSAVLPNNGSSITSPRIMIPEGAPEAAIEFIKNTVNAFDAEIMDRLSASNFRAELGAVSLALVIVGDSLLESLPNGQFRTHRLDDYVVVRKEDGSIYELIIRQWVDPCTLPEEQQKYTGSGQVKNGIRRLEPKYTHVVWNDDANEYKVKYEFRDHDITDKKDASYKTLPFFALKTGTPASSNYGYSLIQLLKGDIRTLMALTLSLIEGAAANAEFRLCVRPGGATNLNHMAGSTNGQWVSANPDDLHVLQLGSPVQLNVTAQMVQALEQSILQALLYNLAYVPDNRERVTATEIQATTQALESGLTGILASITQDLHVPLVKRMADIITRDAVVSMSIKTLAGEVVKGSAPLKLKSGIEALHKEIAAMRLLQGVSTLIRLPEPAWSSVNWRAVTFDLMSGYGFDGSRYLISEEELQARQQAEANMRVQEQTATAVGTAAAQRIGDVNADAP